MRDIAREMYPVGTIMPYSFAKGRVGYKILTPEGWEPWRRGRGRVIYPLPTGLMA